MAQKKSPELVSKVNDCARLATSQDPRQRGQLARELAEQMDMPSEATGNPPSSCSSCRSSLRAICGH